MALKIFEQQLQMCCMLNKNIFWKNYKTSKIWDTMCPNFGSAFWDFHATFEDKSKYIIGRIMVVIPKVGLFELR
jgi:hypothetical protein